MRIVLLATLLLASANGGALPNIADTLKSTDAPSTPDMNQLIDALLNVLRKKIMEADMNVIKLAPMKQEFTYDLWIAKIYGSVGCEDGEFRALTTVVRTGDASGEIFDGTVTVESALGLKILEFSFERCSLRIKDILSFSTPLKGTVANNSIKLQVTVEPVGEEGLKATLSKVELDELSGITITTGRGILAHLKDDIAKGLVWRFHRNIYTSVSSALAKLQGTSFNIPPIGNRFQASTPAPNGTH